MIKARITYAEFDFGHQMGIGVQLTVDDSESKRARHAVRFERNDMPPAFVVAQLRALADWVENMTEDKIVINTVAAKLTS